MLTKLEEILNKLTKSDKEYVLKSLSVLNRSHDFLVLSRLCKGSLAYKDENSMNLDSQAVFSLNRLERVGLCTSKRDHEKCCLEYTITPEGQRLYDKFNNTPQILI